MKREMRIVLGLMGAIVMLTGVQAGVAGPQLATTGY